MRRIHAVMALACLCAGCAAALGADPQVPAVWTGAAGTPGRGSGWPSAYVSQEANDETRRMIRGLSADDFASREKASHELMARGLDAFPGLMHAAGQLNDPEVLQRIAAVFGPPGGDAAPFPSLGNTAATASIRAKLEIARGNFEGAQQDLWEYMLTTHELVADYAALIALRQGPGFDAQKILDAAGYTTLEQASYNELGMLMFRARWDVNRAADYATTLSVNNFYPPGPSLVEAKRYAKIAQLGDHSPAAAPMPESILARLVSGDDASAEKRVRDACRAVGTKNEIFQEALTREQIMVGLLDDALDSMKPGQQVNQIVAQASLMSPVSGQTSVHEPDAYALFMCLCQQLRIREALAALPKQGEFRAQPVDRLMELGLREAAAKVLAGMSAPGKGAPGAAPMLTLPGNMSAALDAQAAYATALERAGETEKAKSVRDSIFKGIDAEGKKGVDEDRKRVVDNRNVGWGGAAVVQGAGGPVIIGEQQQFIITDRAVPIQAVVVGGGLQLVAVGGQMAAAQLTSLEPLMPDEAARRQVQLLERVLLSKSTPAAAKYESAAELMKGKISDKQVEALMKAAGAGAGSTSVMDVPVQGIIKLVPAGAVATTIDPGANPMSLAELQSAVELLQKAGRDTDALEIIYRWYAAHHDPSCWIIAGDMALRKGQPETAFWDYQRARATNPANAALMYRVGLALLRGTAAKETGKHLLEFLPMLVLGSYDGARQIADLMRQFEGAERADEWLDDWQRRFGMPGSADWGPALERQRDAAEKKGDFAGALEFEKQAVFAPLPADVSVYASQMQRMAGYWRSVALDAWARKDFAGLGGALSRELDNGPPDVELMEKVVPALKEGDKAAATKVVNRALERLGAVVADYPEAGKYKEELRRVEALAR